jgi:hypothetical protein
LVGDRWKLVTKLALNAPSVSSPESYRGRRDPCIAHYGRHISRSAFHYELSKHEWSSSVFTWNRIRCFAFRLPLSLFLFPENKNNYASSDDCFSKALPNLDPLSFQAALPLTLPGWWSWAPWSHIVFQKIKEKNPGNVSTELGQVKSQMVSISSWRYYYLWSRAERNSHDYCTIPFSLKKKP